MEQIRSMMSELMRSPTRYDIFMSIQTYDKAGICLSCPIYADFDGEGSHADMLLCYEAIRKRWGTPEVFYSGRKGFHIVLDYPVKGTNCHHIVKGMMKLLGDFKTMDMRVYTERRLFRVNNTYNVEGDRYKIRLSSTDIYNKTVEQIREKATYPVIYEKGIMMGLSLIDISKDYEKIKGAASANTVTSVGRIKCDYLPPCIEGMLNGKPIAGTVNNSIFTICRALRSFSVPKDKCLDMLFSNSFYVARQNHSGDVSPTVNSVYRSKEYSMPNCDENNNATIMKPFCNDDCRYKIIDLWRSKHNG
jgi:hypothetical protein